jgi:hypothetical protein
VTRRAFSRLAEDRLHPRVRHVAFDGHRGATDRLALWAIERELDGSWSDPWRLRGHPARDRDLGGRVRSAPAAEEPQSGAETEDECQPPGERDARRQTPDASPATAPPSHQMPGKLPDARPQMPHELPRQALAT